LEAGDTIDLTRVSTQTNIDLTNKTLTIGSDSNASKVYDFNVVNASAYKDIIKGNDSSDIKDTLKGNAGNDTFIVSDGSDRIEGGADEDTYDFSGLTVDTADNGVEVIMKDSGDSTASGNGVGSSTFIEIENIVGTDGKDTITGDSGVNTIESGDGDDTIFGSDGSDYYDGGDGTNDWLSYNGIDVGSNHIEVDLTASSDQIIENAFGDSQTAINIENIYATDNDDTIRGSSVSNTVLGGDGVDTIHGDSGDDYIYGGLKTDTIYGDDGDDKLYGESDNDTIYGGDGSDTIDRWRSRKR